MSAVRRGLWRRLAAASLPTGPASRREPAPRRKLAACTAGRAARAVPAATSAVARSPQAAEGWRACAASPAPTAASARPRSTHGTRPPPPGDSLPRLRIVSATATRAARHAGSTAARTAVTSPSAPATKSTPGSGASAAGGATSLLATALAVAITGTRSRPSPSPKGMPSATPAAPTSRLSPRSARHTAPVRRPTARSTPSCQARSSNTVESRLKVMRNAATSPKRPSAWSATRSESVTRRRSACRCAGAWTRRPAGRSATITSATSRTSASGATTTSTPVMKPRRVKSSSAAKRSITATLPP